MLDFLNEHPAVGFHEEVASRKQPHSEIPSRLLSPLSQVGRPHKRVFRSAESGNGHIKRKIFTELVGFPHGEVITYRREYDAPGIVVFQQLGIRAAKVTDKLSKFIVRQRMHLPRRRDSGLAARI